MMRLQVTPTALREIRLDRNPSSVRRARQFLSVSFEELGLPRAQLDATALALSEIVTNAVIHGSPPILVRVVTDATDIEVSVWDASPALPRVNGFGPSETGGRGLAIVAAVTKSWGYDVFDHPTRKRVWFNVPR